MWGAGALMLREDNAVVGSRTDDARAVLLSTPKRHKRRFAYSANLLSRLDYREEEWAVSGAL